MTTGALLPAVSHSGRYRPDLDGVRAVAIMLVIVNHAIAPLVGWDIAGLFGWTGVTLFFALSGYLITGILARERATTGSVNLARFYRRRIVRLAPALLVLLLFVGMTGAWQPGEWKLGLISALTYSTNWVRAAGFELGSLNHMWSLAVEEQFYLIWPPVLAFVFTLARPFALAVIVVGLAGSLIVPWPAAGLLTTTCAVALMVGALASMRGAQLTHFARLAPLAPVGRRSYSLYLWNWPMVVLFGPLFGIAATFITGELSYRLIELPISLRKRGAPTSEEAGAVVTEGAAARA